MKAITFLIVLATTFFSSELKKSKISSNYSCPIIISAEGRCTGSAYCSACRNCSRCAHCSNGGSCGVCSGSSNNYDAPKPRKKSRTTSQSYYYKPVENRRTYYENETITIYSELINLREKPSIKSKILEQLTVGDEVLFIEKDGDWTKVRVEETETIGYILSKLLK